MNAILFTMTLMGFAMAGDGATGISGQRRVVVEERWHWREISAFYDGKACHAAAQALGYKPHQYRCIARNTGEVL